MTGEDAKLGARFMLMASTGHSRGEFPELLLFQDCILLWLLYSLDIRYFCLPRNFHHLGCDLGSALLEN